MNQNLKSIRAYQDRISTHRSHMRSELLKWSTLLITANAAAAFTVTSTIFDTDMTSQMTRLEGFSLSLAAFAFAMSVLPSIMAAVSLSLMPPEKAVRNMEAKEVRAMRRYLMFAGGGFIVGMASCVGFVTGALARNLGTLLVS